MHFCETMKVPRALIWFIRSKRLHRRLQRAGQADGAGVVDQDVDAAELGHRLGDGCLDALLVADVAGQRQRLAAGLLDLLGGGEDRAGQARIGFHRLGGDGDVGAVARGTQRDGEARCRGWRR
jgi:hypothetical protein